MSTTTTLTMNSSIQRPSLRSPYAPPTAPLPALPVAKTRTSKALPDTPDPLDSRPTTSGSTISSAGSKTPTRSVTLSGIPTPRPTKTSSTPAVPTLNTTNLSDSSSSASTTPASALPTPARTLRKTTSFGAFPVPPKGTPRTSLPPSPLSIATPSTENSVQSQAKALKDPSKHRSSDIGLKKPKARSSGYGAARSSRQSVGSTTPSLLNGSGEGNFISSAAGARGSESLLSLPSPPQSRSSSANGSYQTDATQFEDVEDDTATERGRPKSQDTVTSKRNSKRQSDIKDNKGNVLVSVRVRPDAGGGGDASAAGGEWMVDGRRSLVSYKGKEEGDYRYDNVFSPHDNNARVYDNAAKRLVRRVMEGYHGTVFAYGMTGTGKTFSMQGTAHQPGVIPLAITDIFSYIRENPNREFLLRVSYLEIYNERIYDLLSQSTPGQAQQEEIKLREDSKRGVYATPLKEEIVQSPNQLLRVIARGDLARRTSSTQFNARSSRSHAVVQIVVESRKRTNSNGAYYEKEDKRNDRVLPGGVLVSTLSLIDLAGSEKAAENKERRTEGAHINKSLLTLGTVIARLSGDDEKDKNEGLGEKKNAEKGLKHLPYRDSKLTRLLQPALSGNSLVSILCTIQLSAAGSAAANNSHTGETLNTLKFASRAKNNIVSHAKRNESSAQGGDAGSRALLDRYRIEIQELRSQLEAQNKAKEEAERNEEFERDRRQEEELEKAEKSRHEEQMLEMQLARTALKERISHLNRLILSSKSIGVNSGRFSSASVSINRMSTLSANGDFGRPVSVRSRDSILSNGRCESAATLEVPMHNSRLSRTVSSGSMTMAVMPNPNMSHIVTEDNFEEDEEGSGGDADGNASLQLQNQALQADLADKNRYIATLEKRLLQARRTSRSRVSMTLRHQEEEGGVEGALRDKERENEELRAKLDDQMRMVNVLRSELRRKNFVDNRRSGISGISEETARPGTANGGERVSSRASSRSNRFTSASRSSHRSNPSNASRTSSGAINLGKSPLSPVTLLSPTISEDSEAKVDDNTISNTGNAINSSATPQAKQSQQPVNRRKSVDEMTMLLDQMIQDKVDSGHVVRGERGSLRIKRDTVMEYKEKMSMEPGAEMVIEETDELD